MKPIWIFRHVAHEGPGYLADVLNRNGIDYIVIEVDNGAPIPTDTHGSAGLVFMGGPMSVNDELAWVDAELALIRLAVAQQLPILGHCLGGQLISKALGGTIDANHCKEIGWLDVERINNPIAQDWLGELPQLFEVFHWHGEKFSIPEQADCILKSDHCDHQAFAFDNVLALQCHVEMTLEAVPAWADAGAAEVTQPSPTVQSKTQMMENLAPRVKAQQRIADALYTRWLQPLLNPNK